MTRLTEALERAQLVPASKHETDVTPASNDEVLRRWHFDGADLSAAPAPTTAPTAATTAPATAPAAPAMAAAASLVDADLMRPAPLRPAPVADDERRTTGIRVSSDLTNKLVLGSDVDPGLVEEYRRLAALLHNAQLTRRIRSVMVASAVAAEGKTLTATNVALTLSHSFERRVLLIDADLRRPSVHEMFQLPNDRGLVDSLTNVRGGRLPVQQVSRTLSVLTAGRPTSDPMSLLVSDAMKQLVADAVDEFDWVIVDTPPVALMPDANLLASMVDTALLVIGANTTPYPLVQRAAAAIGVDRILGVVLNRAVRSGLTHEYGYYHYGYRQPRGEAASPAKKRFGLFGRVAASK